MSSENGAIPITSTNSDTAADETSRQMPCSTFEPGSQAGRRQDACGADCCPAGTGGGE